MTKKKKKKRPCSGSYYRGFHETNIPGDSGYIKPTKNGGKLHKKSKYGPVHKDKYDPTRHPIKHLAHNFFYPFKPLKMLSSLKRIISSACSAFSAVS